MRKIIVSEFVTLDGVMEDPGGAEKSEHGGWSFQFWNAEAAKYKFEELFARDALLLGRPIRLLQPPGHPGPMRRVLPTE